MRTATRSCTTYCAQGFLWDYLADYDNVVRLSSPLGSSRLVSGERRTLHSVHAATLEWEGMASTYRAEMTEAARPERVAWAGKNAGIAMGIQFVLAPLAYDATRVTAELSLKMIAAMLPLEPFAWGMTVGLFEHLMQQVESLEL